MPSPSRASEDALAFDSGGSATNRERLRTEAFGFLSLFTSVGTLVCCALPSLLVLMGLGATVASLLAVAPWLLTLSHYKGWVFAGSGALIAVNFAYVYRLAPGVRSTRETCPTDARGVTACEPAVRMTKVVLWISAVLYTVGFFSAYILGRLLV